MPILYAIQRLFVGVLLVVLGVAASDLVAAELVDTSHSKFAKLHGVDVEQVRWTRGFWKDRTDVCFDRSIPSMWRLMRDGTYKPFLDHFLIAAGEKSGDYHGAKWNDGDFYKWLEAAVVANSLAPQDEIAAAIDQAVTAICAAQRGDGYIHTPVLVANRNGDLSVKPFQDRNAFEMYNMGHLMTTACLHYRLTGDDRLMHAAENAAEFLAVTFGNPTPEQARNSVCPSHYMGVVELYRTTGKQQYLDLAKKFLAMRNLVTDGGDDNQDRIPFLQQTAAVGHAVRANYLYAGAADFYAETGAEDYLNTLETVWDDMATKKLYITGGCGALYDGASPSGSPDQSTITRVHQAYGRDYQLPSITAHNETCANIANVMWCWRMFLLTGESKYVDVLETAFYNSVLSGVSLSGTEYFYVNPLRVTDPLPTELRFPRTRQPFFTSFCCPPNLLRTLAEVGGYAYARSEGTLWVNLYGSNQLTTAVDEQQLSIAQETDYPWQGDVKLTIEKAPSSEMEIRFRIPAWTSLKEIRINDSPAEIEQKKDGFASVQRKWKPGDVITIGFPLEPRLIEAHPLVEEAIGQVAVMRGPVVYCLESQDLSDAVSISEVVVPRGIQLEAVEHSDLLSGVTTLEGTARSVETGDWGERLYREVQPAQSRSIPLRLIPYYAWGNRGKGEMTVWMRAAY